MNTNQNPTPDTTAAPSVTIAPRNPAKGVFVYLVTIAELKITRSYPCRSLESAIALAQRFITGVTKSVPQPKQPAQ